MRIGGMKTTSTLNDVPKGFLARYGKLITGFVSGFDRMRFMGTIRTLQSVRGMMGYLGSVQVLLKDFRDFSHELTARVRHHGHAMAEATGRSVQFLRGSSERKEELVRAVAAREGIREGLIGVFSSVEPCLTYFLRRDACSKHLHLEFGSGQCLHLYYYFLHAEYGLMHLRLQTWFPYNVTLCLNGRQWLARQMEKAGIGFVQKGNCFLHLEDVGRTQTLAAEQLKTDWSQMLDRLLGQCHPVVENLCRPIGQKYYWSLKESEYATDFIFCSPEDLAALYPRFLRHGMENFGSSDVLRFLGAKSRAECVNGNFEAELNSSLKRRPEGVRIKHYAAGNSIKLYDKEGQVLRVETTINRPGVFKVYRRSERHPQEKPRWLVLRRGVADTQRRAQVSAAANVRYCEALAQVGSDRPTGEVTDTILRSRAQKAAPLPSAQSVDGSRRGPARMCGLRSMGHRWLPQSGRACCSLWAKTMQGADPTRRRTGYPDASAAPRSPHHQESLRHTPLSDHRERPSNPHRPAIRTPCQHRRTLQVGRMKILAEKQHSPT